MTYSKPNYTQVPNLFLDEHMKDMNKAELKVMLATCRKTFGWQKGRDRISLTQFEELTGLARSSVQEGITAAIERGVLRRYEVRGGFEYSLVVDIFSDIPEIEPANVPKIEHTKESLLKKTTRGDVIDGMVELSGKENPLSSYPPDVVPFLESFISKFKRNPAKPEKAGWIKAVREWVEIGIRPADVPRMFDYCRERGTVIKSPFSITFAYDEIRNQDDIDPHKNVKVVE